MVLRACPPPQAARPVPRGRPVGSHALPPPGVSRVASDLLCRHAVAITPVGSLGLVASRGVTPSSPATAAFPVSVAGRRPHYSFLGLLGGYSPFGPPAPRGGRRPLSPKAPAGLFSPPPPPLLPAGATAV